MLNELVDKCDEVSSWKKTPYPEFCFHPPYIHPSVTESIQLHPMPVLSDLSNKTTNAGNTLQRDMESEWIPVISGIIHSVLDVAPIRLLRDFFNDVDLGMYVDDILVYVIIWINLNNALNLNVSVSCTGVQAATCSNWRISKQGSKRASLSFSSYTSIQATTF